MRRLSGSIALAVLGISSLASGQQYQADEIDEKARLLGPIAQNCVKNPAQFAADRQRFEDYFKKYYFPAMTRFEPDDLAELGRLREDLFTKFLWASRDEALQRDLTELAFTELSPKAFRKERNYHPAVRYNAILVLGLLDEKYVVAQAAGQASPKPLPKANKLLTQYIEFAAKGNRVPPSLLVGALVGLERHAQYHDSLDRPAVDAMTAAVVKLASMDELLPDAEAKVCEWVRIQAAAVLAKLGNVGPNGQVQAALLKLIAGATVPKTSLDARCQVAALLERINYEGATVDGKSTADVLLQLAIDVADDEAKLAKQFDDMQIAGGGFGVGLGAPGSRRGGRVRFDQDKQRWEYDARVLLARLDDLRVGLAATRPIVPADQQTVFDAVIAAIDAVVEAAEDEDVVDLDVTKKVQSMADQIRGAVKPGSVPAASEDAGELF